MASRRREDNNSYSDGDECEPPIEDPNIRKPKRKNRSAAQRRQQQLRSDTRCTLKLIKGLTSLEQHRGNQLCNIGRLLKDAIDSGNTGSARDSSQRPTKNRMPICRHFLQAKCTFGAACKFAHPQDSETSESTNTAAHVDSRQLIQQEYGEFSSAQRPAEPDTEFTQQPEHGERTTILVAADTEHHPTIQSEYGECGSAKVSADYVSPFKLNPSATVYVPLQHDVASRGYGQTIQPEHGECGFYPNDTLAEFGPLDVKTETLQPHGIFGYGVVPGLPMTEIGDYMESLVPCDTNLDAIREDAISEYGGPANSLTRIANETLQQEQSLSHDLQGGHDGPRHADHDQPPRIGTPPNKTYESLERKRLHGKQYWEPVTRQQQEQDLAATHDFMLDKTYRVSGKSRSSSWRPHDIDDDSYATQEHCTHSNYEYILNSLRNLNGNKKLARRIHGTKQVALAIQETCDTDAPTDNDSSDVYSDIINMLLGARHDQRQSMIDGMPSDVRSAIIKRIGPAKF